MAIPPFLLGGTRFLALFPDASLIEADRRTSDLFDEFQGVFYGKLVEISQRQQLAAAIGHFEQQRFRLEAAALAIRTGRIRPVPGEQDAHVHLVGLGFEPAKITFDAVPGARPFVFVVPAIIGVAIDDPFL